jgi:hypothetical protein
LVPGKSLRQPVEIAGPWNLHTDAGVKIELERLISWTEIDSLQGYSGWATYSCVFQMGQLDPDIRWILDLGELFETAEVELNGVKLGEAWKRTRTLRCKQALKCGSNQLKIRVANLWIHHVLKAPPPDHSRLAESYGIRWGRYGEIPAENVPPAGLLGPVRLNPQRWFELKLDICT